VKISPFHYKAVALALGAAAVLAACGDDTYTPPDYNTLPARITNIVGPNSYDGVTDDLLTAGLGKTGIGGAAPGFVDPVNPTVTELRRRAIYANYRGIIDFTAAGGYGTLYGPNIDTNGNDTLGEGKIAGKEILAYADDGTGKKNVGLMVQIPASFDKNNPCIVTGPSSGSRGIYGGIGTAGDWGLKHGCAVAYTDAGKGTGYQDMAADKVNLIDGRLVSRASAGTLASFASDLTGAALTAFNAAFPNRIAYKHIYSQQNPEKDWGQNVLDSVRFAFWALNEQYGDTDSAGKRLRTLRPDNTVVIASSISNGGAESLQALEQDTEGLIDGLAVAEPNAQPNNMTGVTVNFNGAAIANAGKPLIDYFSYRMLYELCASISTSAQAPNGIRPGWLGFGTAPLGSAFTQVAGVELQTIAENRCQGLAAKGLVTGTTVAQQADSALAKMQAYGWTDPLSNALHASHYRLADAYVAFGYVVAYGKFSVSDNLCGFSLANFDGAGNVAAQVPATQASIFSTSNGLNTGGDIFYNDSVGGARLYHVGVSPSTGRIDGSLDGFLCLRGLVTGVDPVTGAALTGTALANSQRVQAGIRDVLLTGNLHNKPAILVQGRSDTLVPVNHASRAYTAFNSKVEGAANVRYYEIENGNHFDAFLPNAANAGVQGYDALLVPVHYYFMNAMDLMWARLKNNVPLPQSQVVRAIPRGGVPGSAPPITTANVPKISASPAAANTISVGAGVINVPN
jgi:hydroxybutyrate-dimer hydrolase